MSDETVFLVLFVVFAAPFAFYVVAALVLALMPKAKLHPSYAGKHVFITGGSQGLGRGLALQLVAAGANVTIVSRSSAKLQSVINDAEKSATPGRGRIAFESADTCDAEAIRDAVSSAEANFGPIDILFAVAGKATTGTVDTVSLNSHKAAMDLNYFGTLHAIHAVLPGMTSRNSGSLVLVASGAALSSYVGYAAYSPSKYAIRGLAECLRNELQPRNITVHIAYPGQMDTPGFVEEELTKPAACKAIEADDVKHTPEAVAKSILRDLSNGEYSMYCGDLGISVLGAVTAGMSPRSNWALDILLFPIGVLVVWIVRNDWAKKARAGATTTDAYHLA
ncbi:3-ketodihydrosphingosine reductase [Achlya hypogyna]|uniref:3-dehydrosphinganine reductase n=1 Tax=Achlya hypogyna TaxID=1202772 RepID=A0A1V9Z543_ACHHY|nr:3-ketodihydrosphingosine reductase [Achlya hypogyna]